MDLHSWLVADLVSARQRVKQGVIDLIPVDRLGETVDGGGIPAVYVLWHLTRHHDMGINGVLRSRAEIVHDWTDRLGVSSDLWRGLSEGADLDLVESLNPEAVTGYTLDVLDSTIDWLGQDAQLDNLDAIPTAHEALAAIATPEDQFGWLYAMWEGKTRYWFLSWEGHGHVVTHTGELVSLRNRMGLNPFA